MLSTNRSIHTLRICFCSVGSAGLQDIAKGVRANSTLQVLRVWGNNFDQETLQMYEDLLREHASITGLQVDVTVYKVDELYYAAQCKVEEHRCTDR